MTTDDVRSIVLKQIGDQWHRSNLHRVDLRRCLLPPRTIHTISASGEQEQDVWLVLHEAPGGGDGFGVAFDEATGTFGLVEFRHGYDACFLGHYGDFFAALEGM